MSLLCLGSQTSLLCELTVVLKLVPQVAMLDLSLELLLGLMGGSACCTEWLCEKMYDWPAPESQVGPATRRREKRGRVEPSPRRPLGMMSEGIGEMKRAGRSEGPLAGGDGLRLLALDGPSLAGLLFMLVTCTEQRPSRPCRLAKRNQGSGSCCACVHETACAVAAGKHRAAVRLRAPNSPGAIVNVFESGHECHLFDCLLQGTIDQAEKKTYTWVAVAAFSRREENIDGHGQSAWLLWLIGVRETKNHLQRWQQVRCQRGRKEYVSVWKRDRECFRPHITTIVSQDVMSSSKQPRSQKQPSMSKSLSKCRATAFGWHRKKREMNIYSLQSLIDGGFLPLRQILNIGSANKELRTLQSSLCLPGPLLFTSNSGCKSCSNGTTSDQRQANVDGGVGGSSLSREILISLRAS
ncbi:hypothetical protein KCU79_g71, partial [Aureobasidium melanogenum]